MKKNFKKSFIQALIGTSPLLLYILAFIFFPEKTVEFAEGIRTLPDRIGGGKLSSNDCSVGSPACCPIIL